MSRLISVLSLITTILFGYTNGAAQSNLTDDAVRAVIVAAFNTLCVNFATRRTTLPQFVVNFDDARRNSDVWNYVNDEGFRAAFAGTRERLNRGLDRPCRRPVLRPADLRQMMNGYRRNETRFAVFLTYLEDSGSTVGSDPVDIIRKQAQVSAIVLQVDTTFWGLVTDFWSVLMPLSRGP